MHVKDKPFLEFGVNGNQEFGSMDLDFLSYKLGVHIPTAVSGGAAAVPEPASLALLALGLLALGGRARRLR